MTFVVGKLRASALNDLINQSSPFPLGIIARADRQTNSTTTTTEVGVLRLDDVPIYLGRSYRISWVTLGDSSVANDVIQANARYTTDGSTPTTSSTIMKLTTDLQVNASTAIPLSDSVIYTPSADQTLSVLLSAQRTAGSGNVGLIAAATYPTQLVIEDVGLDVTDTGVDV